MSPLKVVFFRDTAKKKNRRIEVRWKHIVSKSVLWYGSGQVTRSRYHFHRHRNNSIIYLPALCTAAVFLYLAGLYFIENCVSSPVFSEKPYGE